MAWYERMQEAKFRGLSFRVSNHGLETGRTVAEHIYPRRETPYNEDLGRSPRRWTLDAYVVGEDYDLQRDRLWAAAEEPGAGELAHPYLGTFQVLCRRFQVKESVDELRMARITFTFVEAGESDQPVATISPVANVDEAAEDLKSASASWMAQAFSVAKMPQHILDAATDTVGSVVEGIENAVDAVEGAVSEFARSLTALQQDAATLMETPDMLASRMTSLVENVASNFDGEDKAIKSYEAASALTDHGEDQPDVAETTSTRKQQAANQEAVNGHTQNAAIAEAARAAVRVEWTSLRQAEAAQSALADEMDRRMETVADDRVFRALLALRAAVAQGLPREGNDLPDVRSITLRRTQPALVVAYELYGDPTRSDEIVERNDLRHPGFVPGGEELEVLSE